MKKILEAIAKNMQKSVPDAGFEIKMWDGDLLRMGEPAQFSLSFKTKNALVRSIKDGYLGFAESYMVEEIEVEGDMDLMFRMGHLAGVGDMSLSFWEKVSFGLRLLRERGSMRRAPINIAHHYDLGNDFFQLFLDPTMAYSCAYFRSPEDSLEQAQRNKFEHICRKLQLKRGESLADLGCGWGGFLLYAAQNYDITGVGVTLSRQQFEYVNDQISSLGLQNRIQVLQKDYRETPGVYDKVASIGMLEHVGKKYIPVCIRKISEILKPGGLGLVHSCMNDIPYPDDPWTMKYLFPGYHIPVLEHVIHEMVAGGMNILDIENLRMHYVLTSQVWLENFIKNRETIESRMGSQFYRCWLLYLNVTVTSFSHGGNRIFHVLFSNGLNNDILLTRDHLYKY